MQHRPKCVISLILTFNNLNSGHNPNSGLIRITFFLLNTPFCTTLQCTESTMYKTILRKVWCNNKKVWCANHLPNKDAQISIYIKEK